MHKKEINSFQHPICRFKEEYLNRNEEKITINKFDVALLYCLPPVILLLFLFVLIKILIA